MSVCALNTEPPGLSSVRRRRSLPRRGVAEGAGLMNVKINGRRALATGSSSGLGEGPSVCWPKREPMLSCTAATRSGSSNCRPGCRLGLDKF